MRIVDLNTVDYGSTGNIMLQIADTARKQGHEVVTFSANQRNKDKTNHDRYLTSFEYMLHYALARLTGLNGSFSILPTLRLIRKIRRFDPDIIHIHNIHGFCLNFKLFFSYIKKENIRVVWTFHDCWPFTGRCPYFQISDCKKWKTGCGKCTYPKSNYPQSVADMTRITWMIKKQCFTGIKNMTVVTPSRWLADLVRESFLREYPIKVIHNGINLDIFKPTSSEYRKQWGYKYIVLGVAFDWNYRKGLDIFIKLAKNLPDEYGIVMVGTDDSVDKLLPHNIISIHRTHNQKELAEIYSSVDVFVNPTREDNFPTVNIESLACGTPVVTFKTGGSPEILDGTCGSVVETDDIEELMMAIKNTTEKSKEMSDNCVQRAKSFDKDDKFNEYVDLYEKMMG